MFKKGNCGLRQGCVCVRWQQICRRRIVLKYYRVGDETWLKAQSYCKWTGCCCQPCRQGRSLPDRLAVSGLLTVMMSVLYSARRPLTHSLINNFKSNGGREENSKKQISQIWRLDIRFIGMCMSVSHAFLFPKLTLFWCEYIQSTILARKSAWLFYRQNLQSD